MKAALNPDALAQYSLVGREADFDKLDGKIPASGLVSVKSSGKDKSKAGTPMYKKSDKKKQKHMNGKSKDRKDSSKRQKL